MSLIPPEQDRLFDAAAAGGYTVQAGGFDGPLDLLLHLIKQNEVDIYNIPIAAITRQYLEYVELMKELNLDIAGEFLVMASTLIQIKSRMLLPVPSEEETDEEEAEDPRAELVRRLIEYQRYKDAAQQLGELPQLGRELFARTFPAPDLEGVQPEEEPLELAMFDLVEAFRRVLVKVPAETIHEVGSEHISIADRINDVLALLQEEGTADFETLFDPCPSREFVVATFLAVLELCKMRLIRLSQAVSFGTIRVTLAVGRDEGGEGREHGELS